MLLQEGKGWKVIPKSWGQETKDFEVHEATQRIHKKNVSHDGQYHTAFEYRLCNYNWLSYYESCSSHRGLKTLQELIIHKDMEVLFPVLLVVICNK